MKTFEKILLSIAGMVVLASVACGSHLADAQACTAGSMMIAGAIGDSECGGTPSALGSAKMVTNSSGALTWTYPAACQNGNVPEILALAEGPSPVAGVSVNVQTVGTPGTSSASFQVTKQTATTVSLLGLTIAVTATNTGIGATTLDLTCIPQ